MASNLRNEVSENERSEYNINDISEDPEIQLHLEESEMKLNQYEFNKMVN